MKTTTIKEVVLVAALLVAGFFLFQQQKQISGLEDSLELVDEKLADRIQANEDKSEELEKTFNEYDLLIQAALTDNQDLQEKINDLRTKRQQDESDIDRINDTDSLSKLFSNYYIE